MVSWCQCVFNIIVGEVDLSKHINKKKLQFGTVMSVVPHDVLVWSPVLLYSSGPIHLPRGDPRGDSAIS